MEKQYYNLTAPQKSIWLTEQYYQNTNINNVCGTFYSPEKIDFEILKKSINIFLKNNDSFKIKLRLINDEVKQYFSEIDNIDFKIIDIKTKENQTTLESQLASKVFSMFDSFLFEIVLFRYPDNHGGFVINSHHLISDSWTNGIVANSVALIYSKLKNNEDYLYENTFSYKDYINSEIEYKSSTKFEKDKKYWNEIFNTIPEVATIPSIKDSSKDQDSLEANRLLVNLDKNLLISIKSYCEKNKVSLYNFFMAVFSLYLGRVSNLDEFVIGTPILNRTTFKEKQTTGMFINTLPLKINLNHQKTFLENLKDIAINSMGLLRHQKYSFQYIIEDLREKDSSLPKLYNVLYSYQITKMNENMDALEHTTSWAFNGTIADDLDIHMFEWNENNSIKIAYDYRINKYDEQDIHDIHARILYVIQQIIKNENILLKDVEIVTPEEKHKILYEFNNTKVDYPQDKTIVDLFEEQVEKTPDNIAVVFEDQQLTYRELNEKSNQLARYLINNGVNQRDIIGICLKKNIDFIISVLATLKCNAIYMPIFTNYPIDRIKYMLDNASCNTIIFSSKHTNFEHNITTNTIDITKLNYSMHNINNLHLPIKNISPAYIIYTSGSTGNPKGVQITHKNLNNFVNAFNKYFNGIDNSDTFLSSTNIAFDVSIWEIFVSLLNGAKLVFNTSDIIEDIVLFCKNIIQYNITALYIPPNILDDVFFTLKKYNYTKISKLLVGVESILNTTLNKYIELNPDIIIINGYGPTETTICATAYNYKLDNTPAHKISIGKPLLNNNIYILSHGSICPIGTPGELFVAGAGVGCGYLKLEEKNKESFLTNPFISDSIMYSTGDIAYWNLDGTITFIGRKDNQIKLHGYRIELSEIDNNVMQISNIEKSYSLVHENKIITYFTATETIPESKIKKYLTSKLPFYMLPSFFIKLDYFPTTINGKINKKALPLPLINSVDYIPPTSPTEKILCSIWSDIFNKEKISITDNFFDLGGDSLTAIKLQTEALKYNLNINYGSIFNNPTIKLLAKQNLGNELFSIDKNAMVELNNIVSINTVTNIPNVPIVQEHTGFLLLGSTGFLGIHILDNLLRNSSEKVYCLIRNKGHVLAKDRLLNKLHFYFGNKYDCEINKRIIIIEGDVTKQNLGLPTNIINILKKSISAIINSSALVKHYGDFSSFKETNIIGTQNIISLCSTMKKKLYHVSTISVSGIDKLSENKHKNVFTETDFFVNQNLNNAYIYTKFKAEALILKAIKNGLDATILRIGNISNRYTDGKFQSNFYDNAYISRLKTFLSIGIIPNSFRTHAIDFSPVDYCSDAIVKIILSKNNFNVFHLFNTKLITFSDLISDLKYLEYNIRFVDDITFKDNITKLLNNTSDKQKLSGIIPDLDSDKELNLIFDVVPKADFTNAFLHKLGFEWPLIDLRYIKLLIEYFNNLGFLE